MSYHVLVVDDDPLQCRSAELTIKNMPRYEVTTAVSGKQALDILKSPMGEAIDLVLLDLVMSEMDGIEVLKAIKPLRPDLPVIIYTAHGDLQKAVAAVREGAIDFIEKQDGPERIQISIENVRRMHSLQDEVSRLSRKTDGRLTFDDIVGDSEPIRKTKELAEQAAKSNIPVLIKGQSGVGKELFARAIHGSSMRAGEPFIPVNCGAIPENLVESTLFGHEKGSFTGAIAKNIGKFREADGGTLFLDEVGELTLDIQVKLLRVLQEGEVEPVGANKPIDTNVRIISATNKDLKEAVARGEFREDLYYRLNVFTITVPSLKERTDDIELLMDHFCKHVAAMERKLVSGFSQDVRSLLKTHPWPGNVRQLQNAIHRAVVVSEKELLGTGDFAHIIGSAHPPKEDKITHITQQTGPALSLLNASNNFKPLNTIEEEVIRDALEFYNWRISEVARKLAIGRSTLYRKMAEYGIQQPGESTKGESEVA